MSIVFIAQSQGREQEAPQLTAIVGAAGGQKGHLYVYTCHRTIGNKLRVKVRQGTRALEIGFSGSGMSHNCEDSPLEIAICTTKLDCTATRRESPPVRKGCEVKGALKCILRSSFLWPELNLFALSII